MHISEFIFTIFELFGTIAFAVSGAMVAVRRRVDLFGVLLLGIITALGGGTIRDVLCGNLPPKMFSSHIYVTLAALSSLFVFIMAYLLKEKYLSNEPLIERINNVFDAIGLGAFSVTGAKVAIAAGFADNGFLVVCLGLITGVGGGILRDVMLGQVPFVLEKRIYAVASILGAMAYYMARSTGISSSIAMFSGVIITFLIRMLATYFKWDLPHAL